MKKTLLFYINAIHDGGAERVIIQLATHFANVGYSSVLVTSFVDDNEYIVPENVQRISIEQKQKKQSRIKRNITRIIELRKLCKKYNAEAVISFMAEPNFRTIIATKGLKTKSIVSVRNDPKQEYKGKIGYLVGKCIITQADGCVFQTEDAKNWFPTKLKNKSKVIFNDVDRIFFDTQYSGGKDIVTLGRLESQKNQKLLINAFSKVANDFPDCNLNIYGIGNLHDELQELINKLNMNQRIILKGLTRNVPKILSEAGIFVLSSDYEGMPNALLEALAIGVPCISTDCPCGGPRTVIQNGENGILIPVNDENAMENALRLLLNDNEYSHKLAICAKAKAQMYKTEIVFAEWKEYVEKIVLYN